jgi:hypothetical protein
MPQLRFLATRNVFTTGTKASDMVGFRLERLAWRARSPEMEHPSGMTRNEGIASLLSPSRLVAHAPM